MKWSILVIFTVCSALFAGKYSEKSRGFEFSFPEDWEVSEKSFTPKTPSKPHETLVSLQRKKADDNYHARFSVVVEKAESTDTKAIFKKAVEFLKGQRFSVATTQVTKLPGVKEVSFEVIATQRDFGLKMRQILFVRNGEVFLLTASARRKKFDGYEKGIDSIFKSFKF